MIGGVAAAPARGPPGARRSRAGERGTALSSLLTAFARRAERAEDFRSEREATRADSSSRDVTAEEREWEAVLGDGAG